eukprot:scaffold200843_cov20-Tisochrysis_lutea.AAC.1
MGFCIGSEFISKPSTALSTVALSTATLCFVIFLLPDPIPSEVHMTIICYIVDLNPASQARPPPHIVIFLTDGGASDKAFIEELLQKHERAAMTTVQCLGVGHGVHRHLVDAMASTTGWLNSVAADTQIAVGQLPRWQAKKVETTSEAQLHTLTS